MTNSHPMNTPSLPLSEEEIANLLTARWPSGPLTDEHIAELRAEVVRHDKNCGHEACAGVAAWLLTLDSLTAALSSERIARKEAERRIDDECRREAIVALQDAEESIRSALSRVICVGDTDLVIGILRVHRDRYAAAMSDQPTPDEPF